MTIDLIYTSQRTTFVKTINMDFISLIKTGNINAINLELKLNPELVHMKNERGFTPLIMASYVDQNEVVELLLDKGVIIDDQDMAGNTALMGVCFKGNIKLARLLISKGADINKVNKLNQTALSYACQFGQKEITELLLKNNVDKSIKDTSNKTAKEYAIEKGFDTIVALF